MFPLSFSQQAPKTCEKHLDSMGCLLNYSRCSFVIPFVLAHVVTSYQRLIAYCVLSTDELKGRSHGHPALPQEFTGGEARKLAGSKITDANTMV